MTTATIKLTAETITTAQIAALRTEALQHGDNDQALICAIALDDGGEEMVGPDDEIMTQDEARDACADVINAVCY